MKTTPFKSIILAVIALAVLLPSTVSAAPRTPAWGTKGTVAHACGGIDNYKYVNSKQALERAIKHGAKAVEIDFAWSSDHTLICAHKSTDFTNGTPTLADFLASLFKKKYNPMTAETALTIMSNAKKRYLIVDTQEDDPISVYAELKRICSEINRPSYMNYIVPQIYYKSQYNRFKTVYPFKYGIFTLYKTKPLTKKKANSIAKFCKTRKLSITINVKRWSKIREKIFRQYNVPVAVHTINNKKKFNKFKKKAIIYTDFLY